MNVFFLIVFCLFASTFVWWAWADAWLRKTWRGAGWRVALALWSLGQAALFVLLLYSRAAGAEWRLPTALAAMAHLWALVVMPPMMVALIGRSFVRLGGAAVRLVKPNKPGVESVSSHSDAIPLSPMPVGPTRRQLLATALVAATPPLAGVVATGMSLATLGSFRVRKFDIAYAGLPAALDGATIAHLSDTHLGRFTTRDDVPRIIDATNRLGADVVAFTGDLIDFDLADLPVGLDLLRQLQPRNRVVLCEGNHDLFQDRRAFEQGVLNAGMPLLLNESRTIDVRGYPLQVLGTAWGSAATGRDPMLIPSTRQTIARRRSDAFSVLLAHHPHAFDVAAEEGVNLTLAGHTHGGQFMLTPNLGPGPLMYKYWSGLYRKQQAACVVSNGIGNWFPLRVNAPAEIVHITLKRA